MLRFCHLRDDAVGAVTVAFFWREEEKTIIAGFSFCNPNDQFERSFGRMIALNRLEKRPILISTIEYAENGKLDVVGTLVKYFGKIARASTWDATKLGIKPYTNHYANDTGLFFSWFYSLLVALENQEKSSKRQKEEEELCETLRG